MLDQSGGAAVYWQLALALRACQSWYQIRHCCMFWGPDNGVCYFSVFFNIVGTILQLRAIGLIRLRGLPLCCWHTEGILYMLPA